MPGLLARQNFTEFPALQRTAEAESNTDLLVYMKTTCAKG